MSLFIYIIFFLSLTNNINNIFIFSTTSFLTKIIYDKRFCKNKIYNTLLQLKLNNFFYEIKILNIKYYFYVYKNNIILIGNYYNIKDIILIKKLFKKKYKNYIIYNNLFFSKSDNNIFVNKYLFLIKIFINLFFNKNIKISKYKILVKDNKVFFFTIGKLNKNLNFIKKIKNINNKINILNIKI